MLRNAVVQWEECPGKSSELGKNMIGRMPQEETTRHQDTRVVPRRDLLRFTIIYLKNTKDF
jgi:hypothetical protein